MALILTGMFYAFTPTKSEWILDNSRAKFNFTVNHLTTTHAAGHFNAFDATITSESGDLTTAVLNMTAQVTSIDTDDDKRDAEFKSTKYFDAARYPAVSFTSKEITKVDDKNYKVAGDMTIHGITKPIVLNALELDPMNNISVAGFKVTGKIRRLDFAVGPTVPPNIVGNDIDIVAIMEFKEVQLF